VVPCAARVCTSACAYYQLKQCFKAFLEHAVAIRLKDCDALPYLYMSVDVHINQLHASVSWRKLLNDIDSTPTY
jgi:hypothetical protein